MGTSLPMASSTVRATDLLWQPDRTGKELVGRHPRGVPGLQRRLTQRTFEAADLAAGGHAFSAAVNGAALAGSVLGF